MTVKTLFRIKFSYKGEDQKGEITKKKLEVLAECVNYSDAEMLAERLIELEKMNKYEPSEYEITLTKIEVNNVLVNNILNESDDYVKGLSELFFSGEQDSVYSIKVKFFGDKSAKEKDTTSIYLVPGRTIDSAVSYIKKYLVNNKCYALIDFMVIGSALDKAENIYLLPKTYDSKREESFEEEEE